MDIRAAGGYAAVPGGSGHLYTFEDDRDPAPLPDDLGKRIQDTDLLASLTEPSPADGLPDTKAHLSWEEILEPHGWRTTPEPRQKGGGTYWTRPGKDPRDGHSAVTDPQGSPVMVVWSRGGSGLPIGEGNALTKTKVWTILNPDAPVSATGAVSLLEWVKDRPRSPVDPARRGGPVTPDPCPEDPAAVGRVHDELHRRGFVVDSRPGAGIRVSPHFSTPRTRPSRCWTPCRTCSPGADRRHWRHVRTCSRSGCAGPGARSSPRPGDRRRHDPVDRARDAARRPAVVPRPAAGQ